LYGQAIELEMPLRHETMTGHLEHCAVGQAHLVHGQLVAGQRAGFVARDQRAAAQALYRGKLSDDDAAPRHARGADGQRNRQRDGQAFRNCRNRKRDTEQKHLLRRISTERNADAGNDRRSDQHGHGDAFGELFHALDQGRFAGGLRRAEHIERERADQAVAAGGDDHAL